MTAYHFGCHHIEKLIKVDAAIAILVDVGNHLIDGLILGFEAQRLHGCFQFLWVNRSRAICVEEIESLTNFLNFFFT